MARVRRSVLFVPGSDRAALRGALESGPDTLVVDLEDTVTPARKHAARALAVAFLGEPAPAGTERAARVNSPATPYFSDGTGMFLLDGRVIDLPVVEAERAVLERARRAGTL
jgi:citrate lyase subunit beta/citryl-CoA lyase